MQLKDAYEGRKVIVKKISLDPSGLYQTSRRALNKVGKIYNIGHQTAIFECDDINDVFLVLIQDIEPFSPIQNNKEGLVFLKKGERT